MALLTLLGALGLLAAAQIIPRDEGRREEERPVPGASKQGPIRRAGPAPPSGSRASPREPPRAPARGAPSASAPIRRSAPPALGEAGSSSGVRSVERVRIVPGKTMRRIHEGRPYWHHYDGRRHWYGWRRHRRFYWTHPHAGYWWWWDPSHAHWAFWWGGYWWRPGPGNVLYVNVEDTYRPYDAAVTAPRVAPTGGSYVSPGGRRTVQVTGAGDAFLYESSGPALVYRGFLARGVERVRFTGGEQGGSPRILLDLKGGESKLLDEEGRDAAPPASAATFDAGLPGPPPTIPEPPPPPSGTPDPPPQDASP